MKQDIAEYVYSRQMKALLIVCEEVYNFIFAGEIINRALLT